MAHLGNINFCFNFKPGHPDIDVIDEINITLTNQTTEELTTFLNKHQDQRVNIIISDIGYLTEGIIQDLEKCLNKNHYLRLNWHPRQEQEIRELLQEYDIQYYYYIFVDNWDQFNEFVSYGVSDIYITNTLGFEMENIHKAAAVARVKIRAVPNLAQSSWPDAPAITKFFIRPEDCYKYSKYIDTFEFFENDSPMTDSKMLYQIYGEKEKWYGDLRAIIYGLDTPIDNRLLDAHWIDSRLNCEKRCAKNHQCKICDRYLEMSQLMSEKEKQFNYLIIN